MRLAGLLARRSDAATAAQDVRTHRLDALIANTDPHLGFTERNDTMTSTQRSWISPQAYERLQQELTTLQRLSAAGLTAGERDENAAAVQRGWQTRIQQIYDLLVNAVVGEDPPDDGIAEPGMVVTIRYDDTGDVETFLLGVRGAEYGDMEVYSVQSPLGAAVSGARPGQQRTYTLPSGAALSVTVLRAVPYGVHTTPGG
jgi:transcription elongation GreA/GreB family factor